MPKKLFEPEILRRRIKIWRLFRIIVSLRVKNISCENKLTINNLPLIFHCFFKLFMKKFCLIISFVFTIFFFSGCSENRNLTQNALYENTLVVSSVLPFYMSYNQHTTNNTIIHRKYFFNKKKFLPVIGNTATIDSSKLYVANNYNIPAALVEAITNGELLVFNAETFYPEKNQSKYIFPNDVKDLIGLNKDTLYLQNRINHIDTIFLRGEINTRNIKQIRFIEEWILNEENFTFQKNVIDYIPIYTDSVTGEKIPLFRVENSFKTSNRFSEKETIIYEYEFPLFTGENETNYSHSPYWNWKNKEKLIDVIIQKVLSGEETAYDYNTFLPITIAEVKNRFNVQDVRFNVFNPTTQRDTVRIIEGQIFYPEIKSVIFVEALNFFPKNATITKNVIGIVPVRYFFDENTGSEIKIFPFIVFFNPLKR